ncbi:hypothetical protein ACHAXT_002583 [Thalassiosira profunda]
MDHASPVDGPPAVDQTLQWAREALRARRSELRQRKRALVAAHQDDGEAEAASNDAHSVLERGRALLAEVEAHSEILGRYASAGRVNEAPRDAKEPDRSPSAAGLNDTGPHQSLINAGDGSFMSRFLQETSHDVEGDPTSDAPPLPVETPDWEGDCDENDCAQQPHQEPSGSEAPLREGQARARLDELIATVRRQGDDSLGGVELETPTKRISPDWDPSSLSVNRRAALKKVQWDEELAAAEEEERRLASFKALPLPGGAEVKSDLFASTQAFEAKTGSVEKLVKRDSKYGHPHNDASSSVSGTFGTFDGTSMASSRTSHDTSFCFAEYETEAERERACKLHAEKKTKKRQLLDTVNRVIAGDAEPEEDDALSVFSDGGVMLEDPSKLRQDIARLEAKLKQKKTHRLATLNDIVDIDLNALFDRLLSQDCGDDARLIVNRLKAQVCGSVNDFRYPVLSNARVGDAAMEEPRRQSLFRRQEEWARQREQKLFNARLQLEAEAMDGITGRPQLSHASRSWRLAKASHDETLELVAKEEGRRRQERESKEKASDELKLREMEELEREAKVRPKPTGKKGVDMERLERLSKPREVREGPGHRLDSETDAAVCDDVEPQSTVQIFLSATPKKKAKAVDDGRGKRQRNPDSVGNNAVPGRKPDEFCGKPSFAEMTDKEFKKLVRSIERRAKVEGGVSCVVEGIESVAN